VVIDEIARMELASPRFVHIIETIFANSLAAVATVHVHEHPVTDALKRRPEIKLITVTRD
jgi:nucleoside-triphosphatase